jgi:hypothetical protein
MQPRGKQTLGVAAHELVDRGTGIVEREPARLNKPFERVLQTASSDLSVTHNGLDGHVIAAETQKFCGWGRGEEATDEVGRRPGCQDPCPAEIDSDIREVLGSGYEVLLVRPANVHEHEPILWSSLC